jgi:hypothetical protein
MRSANHRRIVRRMNPVPQATPLAASSGKRLGSQLRCQFLRDGRRKPGDRDRTAFRRLSMLRVSTGLRQAGSVATPAADDSRSLEPSGRCRLPGAGWMGAACSSNSSSHPPADASEIPSVRNRASDRLPRAAPRSKPAGFLPIRLSPSIMAPDDTSEQSHRLT